MNKITFYISYFFISLGLFAFPIYSQHIISQFEDQKTISEVSVKDIITKDEFVNYKNDTKEERKELKAYIDEILKDKEDLCVKIAENTKSIDSLIKSVEYLRSTLDKILFALLGSALSCLFGGLGVGFIYGNKNKK